MDKRLKLSAKAIERFQKEVWKFYRKQKRDFDWRKTRDPYRIVVSEIMLQQTQTTRVQSYYPRFLAAFPTIADLSRAALPEVIKLWQGLGYNRRARYLWLLAQEVLEKHAGKIPQTEQELLELSGVGAYTARAVQCFAFGKATVLLETNIRSVYLHHFFRLRKKVADIQLYPLIEQTIDQSNPREWYYALMDYGSELKKKHLQLNKQSKHYLPQSQFKGSARELRGQIIKYLTKTASSIDLKTLSEHLNQSPERLAKQVQALKRDGLVELHRKNLRLCLQK